MSLPYHPKQGTIVICDFKGFLPPEMVKRRPAVIVSPRLRKREGLCTIVPLSTTPPKVIEAYHYKLYIDPVLPEPYDAELADMVYTVSLDRLFLPFFGKDQGKRSYDVRVISKDELVNIRQCILAGLGIIP
ncbi:MAG: type II toxin-antitoxin system PemK/MazF family toxin [Chlorobium sp.]|nr:MAG: type II toxin-antitoxin system PemK/MazF family toxin [Chlorobium sp.]